MRRLSTMLAATGLSLCGFAHSADLNVQPLRSVDTMQTAGYSMLVRKEQSLLIRLETSIAAEEREVWWLVFNNPDACQAQPCTIDDIYRPGTRADLIRANDEPEGKGGENSICLQAGHSGRSLMPGLGLSANGLEDIQGAEVQVIVTGSSPGLATLLSRRQGGFSENCAGGQCTPLVLAVHKAKPALVVAAR